METTIQKIVKGSTMETIFDNCSLFSVRYYNILDDINEKEYNPNLKYHYEIKIRHAEGTDANKLFLIAIKKLNTNKN
jgi:hypothetical protein